MSYSLEGTAKMLAGRRKSAVVASVTPKRSANRSASMGQLVSHAVSGKWLSSDVDIDSINGTNEESEELSSDGTAVVAEDMVDTLEVVDIDFVTLGMFIIDEIDFPAPRPSVRDILGGAGSYSALGARLFSPPPLSKSVGWIIDQGTDFPPAITRTVASWTTSALMRPNPDRLTTRGWNGYLDAASEHRSFKYTTPKRRLTPSDLDSTLLSAKVFHIICSPARCRELVGEITARRKEEIEPDKYCKAVFIWEPVPDLCIPSELLNLTNALPLVDVCSPNHTELAGFMGDDGLDPVTGQISTFAVERACEQLMGGMPLQSYTLVVRAGEKGCYIAKNGGRKRAVHPDGSNKKRRKPNGAQYHGGLKPDTDMEALFAGLLQDEEGSVAREEIEIDPGIEKWIPAVHVDGSRVVDPTGGGNCFLGGMGIALARGKGIEEACVWGSVAASFAIEQVGVPTLGHDEHGRETWNAVCVDDRLRDFEDRLRA